MTSSRDKVKTIPLSKIECEMIEAGAMLRFLKQRVSLQNVAAYLAIEPNTVHHRFRRFPALRRRMGFEPGVYSKKRGW